MVPNQPNKTFEAVVIKLYHFVYSPINMIIICLRQQRLLLLPLH